MGKAAFETPPIAVPKHVIDEMMDCVRETLESMGYDFTSAELRDNQAVREYIHKSIVQELEQQATELDAWNIVYDHDLTKILKAEIKVKDKERKEEEAKLEAERRLAEAANKAEEERLRKEGRSLNVPMKDANKAEAILRAAGINVKLLP